MIDIVIISGGQCGADQAGLFAARELNIPSAGIAPAGWKTEAGPAPWLEEYGLVESSSPDYVDRTLDNVKLADGTVIFGRRSVGSNKTEELCRLHSRPCLWVWWPGVSAFGQSHRTLRLWIKRYGIRVLNVAGNRESKNPGIGQFTKDFLLEALK